MDAAYIIVGVFTTVFLILWILSPWVIQEKMAQIYRDMPPSVKEALRKRALEKTEDYAREMGGTLDAPPPRPRQVNRGERVEQDEKVIW